MLWPQSKQKNIFKYFIIIFNVFFFTLIQDQSTFKQTILLIPNCLCLEVRKLARSQYSLNITLEIVKTAIFDNPGVMG